MKSTRQMIEQCEGLLGTGDVNEWEGKFINTLLRFKENTARLSEKQIEILERIYNKHFA